MLYVAIVVGNERYYRVKCLAHIAVNMGNSSISSPLSSLSLHLHLSSKPPLVRVCKVCFDSIIANRARILPAKPVIPSSLSISVGSDVGFGNAIHEEEYNHIFNHSQPLLLHHQNVAPSKQHPSNDKHNESAVSKYTDVDSYGFYIVNDGDREGHGALRTRAES